MTEWVIVAWLTGCAWLCDTEEIPTFPEFKTKPQCEQVLQNWIQYGNASTNDWTSPLYRERPKRAGKRKGKCEPREIIK